MEQLLQLAKSSKNGATFTALWNGLTGGIFIAIRGGFGTMLSSRLLDWARRRQDGCYVPTVWIDAG